MPKKVGFWLILMIALGIAGLGVGAFFGGFTGGVFGCITGLIVGLSILVLAVPLKPPDG
jgi:hypothetical protein